LPSIELEETLVSLEAEPGIFAAQAVAGLRHAMEHAFACGEPLLLEREKKGQVRRYHGDLHLRNIVLIEDQPVLFDAIEFDETIATCDVLYDLAFLLMDLWIRGLHRHANLLLNRYLWICDDIEVQLKGLSLLPLFLSLRAAIRAKVAVLRPAGAEDQTREARHYLEAACALLAPRRLDLVAIGGLSGTGKSSLAAALAGSIGRAPGAVHLRSDIERKRLFDVQEFDRLPEEAYRPETTARVYQRLRNLAATALYAGQSVVIDAVHLRPEERTVVAEIASRSKAHFTGLWLEAPVDRLIERSPNASWMHRTRQPASCRHRQGSQPEWWTGVAWMPRFRSKQSPGVFLRRSRSLFLSRFLGANRIHFARKCSTRQQGGGSKTAAPSSLPARRSAKALFAWSSR
jgi:uncharacterized protein